MPGRDRSIRAPTAAGTGRQPEPPSSPTVRPSRPGRRTPTLPAARTAVDQVVAAPVVPSTAPVLPRHVAIVGDSQAHALAINLPDGIGDTFDITDGSSTAAACTTRAAC